ncbi:hypothetical protein D3C72_731040 [compost metagenome]
MNRTGTDEIIIFVARMIFQHAVQVRNVLEVVCVDITACQRGVGQDVVLERFDLQIDTLFRQNRLRLLQNFSMRGVGRPYGQCIRPGGKAQGAQGCGGNQCQCLFHDVVSCVFYRLSNSEVMTSPQNWIMKTMIKIVTVATSVTSPWLRWNPSR